MTNKLDIAIEAYSQLNCKEVISREASGTLPEDKFERIKNKLESCGLLSNSRPDSFKVEFTLPSDKDAFFALDIEELLTATSRKINPPKEFYLAAENYRHNEIDEKTPTLVKHYLVASKLAKELLKLSDYSAPEIPKAVFLHGEKLELSLAYNLNDLSHPLNIEPFVSEFINAEIHKDQKITIVKSVLIEMLRNSEIDRFSISELIKRFPEFIDRINSNYQLYVSEFSFEKIKIQIEHEKFEFTTKLNSVFSGIQNQLLAIPVALVLIGGQMQKSEELTLKNLSIWLGSIVFALLMSLLIRNQKSTLNAIKLEVDSQWSNIKDKHRLVSDMLSKHYLDLNDRFQTQITFLTLISIVVSISVTGSTMLLLYNSSKLHLCSDVAVSGIVGGLTYILLCLTFKKVKER